jgi:hypothetical protein
VIIDYHEVEPDHNGGLSIHVGIQFEDEPESLYVVSISADKDAKVTSWQLLFNGFDCKYTFKAEEKLELQKSLELDGILIYDAK